MKLRASHRTQSMFFSPTVSYFDLIKDQMTGYEAVERIQLSSIKIKYQASISLHDDHVHQ